MSIDYEHLDTEIPPEPEHAAGSDQRLDKPAPESDRHRFDTLQFLVQQSHISRLTLLMTLYDALPQDVRTTIETEAARLYPDNEVRQKEYRLSQATTHSISRHPDTSVN